MLYIDMPMSSNELQDRTWLSQYVFTLLPTLSVTFISDNFKRTDGHLFERKGYLQTIKVI